MTLNAEMSIMLLIDGDIDTGAVINDAIDTLTVLDGEVENINIVDVDMETISQVDGEMGVFLKISDAQAYQGQVVVTPSEQTQVLNTIGKVVGDNITINPIPSNYGKIGWNGAYLTVT